MPKVGERKTPLAVKEEGAPRPLSACAPELGDSRIPWKMVEHQSKRPCAL